jgi:hypothetical protein
MYYSPRAHSHDGSHPHQHRRLGRGAGAEQSAPTEPSRAVFLDVGEHAGALVLMAPSEREGLEVEIHPASDPTQRTHVWVLPREGKDGTVYAAVFPSLAVGDYAVLGPDGSVATTVVIRPNGVTNATWG